MSEELNRFRKLADDFGARVAAAPDDAWGNEAPCEGWTARDVVGHVVSNMRRIAGIADDIEATPMADDEDPKVAWSTSYAAALETLGRDGVLDKVVPGPMGMQLPVSQMLGRFICNDTLVHTWDLARAVGGDERLDQDAVAGAYSGLKPLDAMIRQPGVFGPKVEAPEGADLQTEFLCFLGRKV